MEFPHPHLQPICQLFQNAKDFVAEHPLAAAVVKKCMYVDDCLTGADTVEGATKLQMDLQELFEKGYFITPCKWNSSDAAALKYVPTELRESHFSKTNTDTSEYSKTLGIEWNTEKDAFHLTIATEPPCQPLTKCVLTSDIAKTSTYWAGTRHQL